MRNKAIGIETLIVMVLMIMFAFVIFMVIDAGTNAYGNITQAKQSTTSARVAYSYISMKVKQNDSADAISVEQTEYGDTLRIDGEGFSTFIFHSAGALYECVTKLDKQPKVSAANKITTIDGFYISQDENSLHIRCVYNRNEDQQDIIEGVVGLRS